MQQAALAVVGEDDGIGLGDEALVIIELRRERFVARRALEVDAQQLLLVADHAQLHRGGKRWIAMQRGLDVFAAHQLLERIAGFVRPDHREKRRTALQRGDVARDVRRATRALFRPAHEHDGNGRFRRDAIDVAEPVAIEHDVADHEDAGAGEVGKRGKAHLPIAWYSRPCARTTDGS